MRHYYRAARRGEAGSRVKVYEVDGPLFFASAMPVIKQARGASPSRDPSRGASRGVSRDWRATIDESGRRHVIMILINIYLLFSLWTNSPL